ncbi:MAG: PaaX family transcriptional regulator C-terminal domain-containing protein [Umezawaea sp.]
MDEQTDRLVLPETLLLALFGRCVLDTGRMLAVGSIIAVLGRLGVGEPATRATLSRMTKRGLLRPVKRGRQVFLGLTAQAAAVLADGSRRIEQDVVDRRWDGYWTLLTFSVPETRRADRHALRARLGWAGFGLLRSGLWVSARDADVSADLAELDLLEHADTFRAEAVLWSDPARIAGEAWDLPGIAESHHRFLAGWTGGARDGLEPVARQVLLDAEWLLLIRRDPRLPLVLLPADWPGVPAERLFRAQRQQLDDSDLEMIPDPQGQRDAVAAP